MSTPTERASQPNGTDRTRHSMSWRLSRSKRRAERANPRLSKRRLRTQRNCWCAFGRACRFGLKCWGKHAAHHHDHFEKRELLRRQEQLDRCAYCANGLCSFGSQCRGVSALHPASIETQCTHPTSLIPLDTTSPTGTDPGTDPDIQCEPETQWHDAAWAPRRRYHKRRRRGRGAHRRALKSPRRNATASPKLETLWAKTVPTQTGAGQFSSFSEWYGEQLSAVLKALDLRVDMLLQLSEGFEEEPIVLLQEADRFWTVVGSTSVPPQAGTHILQTEAVLVKLATPRASAPNAGSETASAPNAGSETASAPKAAPTTVSAPCAAGAIAPVPAPRAIPAPTQLSQPNRPPHPTVRELTTPWPLSSVTLPAATSPQAASELRLGNGRRRLRALDFLFAAHDCLEIYMDQACTNAVGRWYNSMCEYLGLYDSETEDESHSDDSYPEDRNHSEYDY
jgi:hypothetical protein